MHGLVYAQHGHELMGWKSPVGRSPFNGIGICLTSDRSITSQATGRSSLGAAATIGGCERTRWTPIAPSEVTPSVI